MNKQMRRKKQLLNHEETLDILKQQTSGVLALLSDDDYPYALPISYVYHEGHIYFHCAKTGHKIDAIKHHNKVSFCVIEQDHIVPEEYTTYFRSAIAFGTMTIVEDEMKKREIMTIMSHKYAPMVADERMYQEMDKSLKAMHVLDMKVEEVTGKESIELVRQR